MDPVIHQSNRADGKPTVIAAGSAGSTAIHRRTGRVNMAAGASVLVVTNKLATDNSVIIATVGSNDSTLKSVSAVSSPGYFVLYGNAAATAETRISFLLLAGA